MNELDNNVDTVANLNNNNNINNKEDNDGKGQIMVNINWTNEHELILIDWADKALCYKWMHNKAHQYYSKKNTWFTIPVIIMSTFTGTANFAQDRIPQEYINLATMIIGTINLIAGILTTIQQYLKISELNESHRVSSISWGKFYRNIKVEISKSPNERTPVISLLKHSKEEFDRLIESSPSLEPFIIKGFIDTFSGGIPQIDDNGNETSLTSKQKIFNELKKPDICGEMQSTSNYLYKPKDIVPNIKNTSKQPLINTVAKKIIDNKNKKNKVEEFINSFKNEKKRPPSRDELINNMDSIVPLDIIESVYTELQQKLTITIKNEDEESSDELV